MTKKTTVVLGIIFCLTVCSLLAQDNIPLEKKFQTKLGKHVTASQAYEMWQANPDTVKILDCRTPEEYVFIGHPPMAHNIPFQLWAGKWDATRQAYILLKDNPYFLVKVMKKFKPADTILILCSSGGRSAKAVDLLADAGFRDVYNVICGSAADRAKSGKNEANSWEICKTCWQQRGAPWTSQLNPELLDIP